jgi:ComF family protein
VRCVFSSDKGSLTLDVPPSETSAWRAVARVLRSPMDTVSCALLPSDCALCGSPLPRLSSVPICDACWMEFSIQKDPACSRCGEPLRLPDASASSLTCRVCRLAPPAFVRAVSYGLYEGRMRDAIHALKYGGLHAAARRLGAMLAAAVGRLAPEAPAEMLVIPVPLHRSKHGQRGFNQARLLAVHALAGLGRTHPGWKLRLAPSVVIRIRATESQASLTPRQRRINLRGAFLVPDPTAVAMKHILLIDDIFTTGATARSVAQVLMRSGAASVWVATLARARRIFDRPGASHTARRIQDSTREAAVGGRGPDRPDQDSPACEVKPARMHASQNQPSF